MIEKIHGKRRKTWMKTQTSIIKYMEEKFTEKKKPTVRENFSTNLTARCEPRHSTLSSWDKNYLNLFSFVHN